MTLGPSHDRILAALRTHGSVTPYDFEVKPWSPVVDGGDEIQRLAARINELRDYGYDIETVMETTGRGKRHARYFLRSETIDDSAGASGASSPPAPDNAPADASPVEDERHPEEASETLALFDLPRTQPGFDDVCPPGNALTGDDIGEAA